MRLRLLERKENSRVNRAALFSSELQFKLGRVPGKPTKTWDADTRPDLCLSLSANRQKIYNKTSKIENCFINMGVEIC